EGGLGTLPLAPLCRLQRGLTPEQGLPAVIRRIDERLRAEATPEDARKLLAATYVLTGLLIPGELIAPLFQGLQIMRESSSYQLILDEGRVEELQETILRHGGTRFGPPSEAT